MRCWGSPARTLPTPWLLPSASAHGTCQARSPAATARLVQLSRPARTRVLRPSARNHGARSHTNLKRSAMPCHACLHLQKAKHEMRPSLPAFRSISGTCPPGTAILDGPGREARGRQIFNLEYRCGKSLVRVGVRSPESPELTTYAATCPYAHAHAHDFGAPPGHGNCCPQTEPFAHFLRSVTPLASLITAEGGSAHFFGEVASSATATASPRPKLTPQRIASRCHLCESLTAPTRSLTTSASRQVELTRGGTNPCAVRASAASAAAWLASFLP
eukprot:362713-Chlamydomonas_euryale.AAC.24